MPRASIAAAASTSSASIVCAGLQACQADREKTALDLQTVDVEEGSLREELKAVEAEIQGISAKSKELEDQVRRT